VEVRAPNGTAWSVRVVWQTRWRPVGRRFLAWRRRRRADQPEPNDPAVLAREAVAADRRAAAAEQGGGKKRERSWSGWDLLGFDDLWGLVAVLAFLVFVAFAWWVLIPVLLIFLDAIVVALVLAAAIPLRVLLRRPWTVAASLPGEDRAGFAVEVVGWRAAREARDEIAGRIQAGLPPAPADYRSLGAA
jgi:hypothetical protein